MQIIFQEGFWLRLLHFFLPCLKHHGGAGRPGPQLPAKMIHDRFHQLHQGGQLPLRILIYGQQLLSVGRRCIQFTDSCVRFTLSGVRVQSELIQICKNQLLLLHLNQPFPDAIRALLGCGAGHVHKGDRQSPGKTGRCSVRQFVLLKKEPKDFSVQREVGTDQ